MTRFDTQFWGSRHPDTGAEYHRNRAAGPMVRPGMALEEVTARYPAG